MENMFPSDGLACHNTNLENIRFHCWLLLWSSGQSSWLQIQRSGFDLRNYQIFYKVAGLERVHSAS
jgi:hypothetical protein